MPESDHSPATRQSAAADIKSQVADGILRKITILLRAGFLLAFAICGARALYDQNLSALADTGPHGWGTEFTPEATTDAYLKTLLRDLDPALMSAQTRPADHLRTALADLEENGALLFAGDTNDVRYLMVYLTVCQMVWPRPVYDLRCDQQTSFLPPPPERKMAGILLFRHPPAPGMASGKALLPGLTLVHFNEQDRWNSLCSRWQ